MKGSIRQRGKTYTAYWFTIEPGTGKRKQHSKGGFRTQGAAQSHLNSTLAKVEQGGGRPDRKMTVEELLNEWHAARTSEGIRPSTLSMYRNIIDAWLVPHIGGLRLDQLNASWAGHLVNTLRSPAGSALGRGGLSSRSVQASIQTLKAATRWAFETELVSRDPLAGFKRPRAKAASGATDAWTAEEATTFLSHAANDRMRAAWWLLLGRGLRRGEVVGLKWANVDLEAKTIRIIETRVVVGSKAEASTPKTEAGRRMVRLDDHLVAELRSHRARQAEERLRAGEAWEHTDYLFVNEIGEPYRPETLSRQFSKLTADAGLRPIRLHDLRHTAATLMLASGEPPKVVAEILGHSSPTITLNVYAHAVPGMAEAAGARLTNALMAGS